MSCQDLRNSPPVKEACPSKTRACPSKSETARGCPKGGVVMIFVQLLSLMVESFDLFTLYSYVCDNFF